VSGVILMWRRRSPAVLTEAEVVDAEAELKALQRHALEVVEPKGGG
jgi:hypothetical protein